MSIVLIKFFIFFTLFSFALGGCAAEQENNKLSHHIKLENVKTKINKEAMVLEIGSNSCRTCIKMKKLINSMVAQNSDLPIYILDVYDDMSIFSFFKLQVIPTQIVLNKNGKEVYRHMGGLSEQELLELVEISKKK